VVALHARLFDTSRLSVAVAGGAEVEEVLSALEDAFYVAPKKPPHPPPAAPPKVPAGPRLVVVDKPGRTIATIVMGAVGPAYGSTEVGATWLALDTLADSAFGRLTTQLRDQVGDVARLSSDCSWLGLAGEVSWEARAPTERVGPVLVEAERVLRQLAAEGPREDELADVKGRRRLAFASWFETTSVTSRELSLPLVHQKPDDTLAKFPDLFATLSASDVKAAVGRYFDPTRVHAVIVGDGTRLLPSLTALGWGPVELRTVDAAVVPPARAKPVGRPSPSTSEPTL
jgi:zinc protease